MYLPFQLLHSIIGLRKLVLYNYHKQPKQKVYLQRALFISLFDNQTRIFVTGYKEYKLLLNMLGLNVLLTKTPKYQISVFLFSRFLSHQVFKREDRFLTLSSCVCFGDVDKRPSLRDFETIVTFNCA